MKLFMAILNAIRGVVAAVRKDMHQDREWRRFLRHERKRRNK